MEKAVKIVVLTSSDSMLLSFSLELCEFVSGVGGGVSPCHPIFDGSTLLVDFSVVGER